MGIIFSIIMTVASVVYQQARQNKLKNEMDKRKQVAFTVDGEPFYLPVVYGRAKVSGGKTRHSLRNHYFPASIGSGGVEFQSNLSSLKFGRKHEFYFMQQAICYGGINSIKDIEVDNKNYDDDSLKHGQRINVYKSGGVADPMATANGAPSTNLFTRTAYASMAFRLNRDDYNYNGSPNVSFYVEGQKIYDIVPSGGSYTRSASTIYSNNPSLVLLDYLTNTVYGRGLPIAKIDLESFYNAKVLCDTIVRTSIPLDGRIWGKRPDVENEWGTITAAAAVPPRDMPLYECNIVIDTERTIRDNVELILESMNEAELIWSGGVYKLKLDYPMNLTEQNNLIVAELTSDDIIRETMSLTWPDSSTRYNQAVVRFSNEGENFTDDTVTWPDSLSAVHLTYLAEDSGQPLKAEMFLPATTDSYHALAKAEQIVRSSRKSMKATFVVGKKGLLLEPGDIITVDEPSSGLYAETFKVQSVSLREDLTAELEVIQYDYTTFAWNVTDTLAYSPKLLPYNGVTAPTNAVFVPNTNTGLYGSTSGTLTWDASNDSQVTSYRIEISSDGGVTWRTLSTTPALVSDVPGLNTGTYKFSVTAVSSLGRSSSRLVALDTGGTLSSFSVVRTTADQVAVVYGDTSNHLTNTQSYTYTSQQYVAYYIYSGSPPTLPIRTGIVFSKFVGDEPTNTAAVNLYQVTSAEASAPAVPSTSAVYTFATGALTGSFSPWTTTPPAVTAGNVLWQTSQPAIAQTSTVALLSAGWSTVARISGVGLDGYNTATLYLYRVSTSGVTAPTAFTGTGTYNFSADTLTGMTLNSWTRTPPTVPAGSFLWVRVATASSTTSTDTIAIGEWSTASVLSGTGLDGLNTRQLFLYAVNSSSSSAPSAFIGTGTYTFATDALTGLTLGSWSRTQPTVTAGLFLWVSSVTASSSGTTASIPIATWSAPVVLSGTGTNGVHGLNTSIVTLYNKNTSTIVPPTGPSSGTFTYTFSTGGLVDNSGTLAGWSTTQPTLSTGEYLWSRVVYVSATTPTYTFSYTALAAAKVQGGVGVRGAGWYRYDISAATAVGLSSAAVLAYWNTFSSSSMPQKDDMFVLSTTHSAGPAAYKYTSGAWVSSAAFIDGNFIVQGTIYTEALEAGAVVASKITVSAAGNLYPDYDMFDRDFYSTPDGATYIHVANSNPDLGRNHLQISPNAADVSVVTKWFPIDPNTPYSVGGATWLSVNLGGTTELYFETASVNSAGVATVVTTTLLNTNTHDFNTTTSFSVNEITTGNSERLGRFYVKKILGGSAIGYMSSLVVRKKEDGSLIVNGSIEAKHMGVDSVDANSIVAGEVKAKHITIDELLEINTLTAGFSIGKLSVNDPGDGMYVGRTLTAAGANGFGFMMGKTDSDGVKRYIRHTTDDSFQIVNAKYGLLTDITSAPTLYASSTTVYLSDTGLVGGTYNINNFNLVLLGGGGGGASTSSNGNNGGTTTIELYDGAVYQGITWTATGGAGGLTSVTSSAGGGSSPYGSGGRHGYIYVSGHTSANQNPIYSYKAPTNATGYGSGGGGSGGLYTNDRESGKAGQLVLINNYNLAALGLTAPKLVITVGAAGTGGATSGSPGLVYVERLSRKVVPCGVIPLYPTATGTFTKAANATGNTVFPDLGVGMWTIWETSSEILSLNSLKITDAAGAQELKLLNARSVSFVANIRPDIITGNATARTIGFAFYKMKV